MIITLNYWFRVKFNKQGKLLKAMSSSVYTVYITHTPVIVIIALLLKNIQLTPLIKFLVVAPVAVSIWYQYLQKPIFLLLI
jgi:glucans biosynthesis protein C